MLAYTNVTPGTAPQRYDVLDSLARGGMAEVLLARQRGTGAFERYVVLKATLPHLQDDSEFVASFLAEARLAAQLSHPNIAQIFDIAHMGRSPCIVMEWLRGRDLRAILHRLAGRDASMPLPVLVRILLGAAAALGYAHRATDTRGKPLGIVHRDVSPHNIFVTRDGGVKLIDFGVAKSAYQKGRTEVGVLKGKLAYMSPEQARGTTVDARSDLWSLGVVAWECATGERLFRARTPLETLLAVTEEPIRRPSTVRPEVDEEMDGIVMALLERDPSRRPADAHALEHALEAWARRRSVPSPPALGEWLTELFPPSEDKPVPEGRPTTSVELRSVEDTTDPTLLGHADATIVDDRIALDDMVRTAARGARARRRWLGAGVGMLAAAVVAAVAVPSERASAPNVEAKPVRPVEARADPSSAPSRESPRAATLRVVGLPEGAALLVDGVRASGSEAQVAIGAAHRVVVRDVDGRPVYDREITTERDVTIPLTIAPFEGEVPRSGPRETRRSGAGTMRGPVGMGIDWSYE